MPQIPVTTPTLALSGEVDKREGVLRTPLWNPYLNNYLKDISLFCSFRTPHSTIWPAEIILPAGRLAELGSRDFRMWSLSNASTR